MLAAAGIVPPGAKEDLVGNMRVQRGVERGDIMGAGIEPAQETRDIRLSARYGERAGGIDKIMLVIYQYYRNPLVILRRWRQTRLATRLGKFLHARRIRVSESILLIRQRRRSCKTGHG